MSKKNIWDPLRKKSVPLTPEEEVRQWFISIMVSDMHIPTHMMMSEVSLKYGQGPLLKEYRADIVAYDRKLAPAMLVECKRPDVALEHTVLEQALRYCMVLNVKYIIITNGKHTHIFRKDRNGRLECMDKIPVYEDIISEEENLR